MVKKVTVALVDDLDGKSAADETVRFSLDDVSYEIDLTTQHAEKLRGELKAWIHASRRVAGRQRRSSRSGLSREIEGSAVIREWARRNGHPVSERGRIPRSVIDAFNTA
ncbi:MAG: Lsr2 family protein [Mycobacteriaceae bacterium]|nr:Lsr2 family protein [Mycobacteriaceae bacterium]MBV9641302.1 Lsr2 family protein [Mycobacteriaceae bacterium]